MADLSNQAKQL